MNQNFFTQLSIPLARSNPNLAPLKPLSDAIQNKKVNKTPSRFEAKVRDCYTAKMKYEEAAWHELIGASQLVSLFRKGNQIGLFRRPYGAPGYYIRPVQQGDGPIIQTAMNFMTFHSQVSESKLMAVNPVVNMRPGDDTPEAIASAQACRPVVDNYETEWYTARFTRRESVRFLTDGMIIHQVRWNPFKGCFEVQDRQVSRRDITIDPGSGMCADCQHEAEADEFTPADHGFTCPNCGSEATDVRPAVRDSIAQIGMGQSKSTGEPEIISSPLACWRWDLHHDLEDSSWAIKRQRISQGAINLMLGDITIADTSSSDDYGLEILHALAYGGQPVSGTSITNYYGRDTSNTKPTMAEFWLSPEDQAEIECDEGETVCGIPMPKGRLSNFFRGQSCCIVGLNDMSLIVGVYAGESHQTEVITSQWFMDAESGVGRGMQDTVSVQKRFNAVDGQVYQGMATTATPPVFIDMRMVKEDNGQYLFTPGVNHDVNLSMLPPGMKMQDAIYLPSPGTVNPQYIQYGTQFLKQMADLSSLAVEFSDLLNIDNRTATGAQITQALANSLYGPMLMGKGETRVAIAKKIVQLTALHGVAARYFPGQGSAQGRMVSAKDLKGQVIFELMENSHLPVTPYSRQADVTAFLQAVGGVQGALLLKQDPALTRTLTRPYPTLNFEDESADDISTLCLSRLEQMKMNLQNGVDDPAMLVQMLQPPISTIEPKHQEKAEWYARYLDLENGQKAPIVLRQAIEAAYWTHMNLETQKQMPQAMNAGLVQAAGAAPAAIGAAALQGGGEGSPDTTAQDHAHEAEMQQRDQELEDQHHLEDQDHEARLKAMEIAGQAHITKLQGENAARSAEIAGRNQLKVERAKPRVKPAAKSAA